MSNKNEVFEYLIDQLRQQVNNNLYKQQCEDLAHEVLSLKNQLRDASAQIKELNRELSVLANAFPHEPEQYGCRKEDAQECKHEWSRYIVHPYRKICLVCGAKE